jgi:transmembrane sensor
MNARHEIDEGEDDIRRVASAWLARRRDSTRALSDERAFRDWYDADPRHAEAYEAMNRTLSDVASMKALADLEPLEAPAPRHRRVWYAAGGLAAAAAAAFLVILVGQASVQRTPISPHATQIAQVDTLRLDDGSIVTLGAASSIDVRFTQTERRVLLQNGQAFFDVAEDSRPFVVEAGDAIIRDIGTRFDVNRSEGRVRVSVSEGIVQVSEPPRGLLRQRPDPVILRAGVRAEVRDSAEFVATANAPTLSRAIAPESWREGRFVYDDVRLGDLVSDLNRYYAPGVRFSDSSLAEIRVAASFRADEIDTFLATLPSAAPVEVIRGDDGAVRLARRAPE